MRVGGADTLAIVDAVEDRDDDGVLVDAWCQRCESAVEGVLLDADEDDVLDTGV